MTQNTVETAEFVLPGHPDKLCDAVVDSLVDAVRRDDLGTWRRYVAAAAPVVDLARWGSQQGGTAVGEGASGSPPDKLSPSLPERAPKGAHPHPCWITTASRRRSWSTWAPRRGAGKVPFDQATRHRGAGGR
jgi:hypothetical protein